MDFEFDGMATIFGFLGLAISFIMVKRMTVVPMFWRIISVIATTLVCYIIGLKAQD